MRLIIFAVLFGVSLTLYAQQTESFITPLERGNYLGDQRVGVWEYYDSPNTLALKVDYTNGVLVYHKPDTSKFVVNQNEKWIKKSLAIPCRFHGSYSRLYEHYLVAVKGVGPAKIRPARYPILVFEVGEDGLAVNPRIEGDNWSEAINKSVLTAFYSAPNAWIVGITPEGEAVRCRMAMQFHFCDVDCKGGETPTTEATLLYKQVHRPPQAGWVAYGRTAPGKMMDFSPDDTRLFLEIAAPENPEEPNPKAMTFRRTSIIDLEKGVVGWVPYLNVKGTTWLDNERVLFEYQNSVWPYYAATYNTYTNEIEVKSDSTTFYHIASPKERDLVFSTEYEDVKIWKVSLDEPGAELIYRSEQSYARPEAWSPDHKTLLLKEIDVTFTRWHLLDVSTGKKQLIPLLGSDFLDFSADGKKAYLLKRDRLDYSAVFEFFSFDIPGHEITSFLRLKNVRDVDVDPVHDRMLIVFDDKVYLYDLKSPEERELLFDDALSICWSNNGKLVAYIHAKDKQVHVFDIDNRTSRRVSNFKFPKK